MPEAATLHPADDVALLRPEEQMLTAMLGGFANQQLARNLARSTVEGRENTVKAFAAYVNAFPWQWTSAMVDEWLGDLRSLRDLKRSTIRSYSEAVRSFCHFATDPLYEWASACEERFGSHPVHVVHEAKNRSGCAQFRDVVTRLTPGRGLGRGIRPDRRGLPHDCGHRLSCGGGQLIS
ncbi:hypothetical protein ABT126_04425 [Streptomyces sp. NPDC002012]|uniref:hypothetical protein n=1 Tax=Streptomyces sp. NPDC002012 TaxID=3154532 RepID=UPI00333248CD